MHHIWYLLTIALTLPCMAMADTRGDSLVERADSLYGAQQYKEVLSTAREALPLTRGSQSEADSLNLLAIINIRLSDYKEAARYAKDCCSHNITAIVVMKEPQLSPPKFPAKVWWFRE